MMEMKKILSGIFIIIRRRFDSSSTSLLSLTLACCLEKKCLIRRIPIQTDLNPGLTNLASGTVNFRSFNDLDCEDEGED